MAFVIDDAVIAAAGEVVSAVGEVCSEVQQGISESALRSEFSEESFSPQIKGETEKSFDSIKEDCGIENTSISKEFSPSSFEGQEVLESQVDPSESLPEDIERTSTFEDQTVNNFELEEQRASLEGQFNLGQLHDADVLRGNMEVAMDTQTDRSVSRAHHIVGKETPNAAKKLEEFGIDRNDPANGILLPNDANSPLKGSIHSGRHLQEYYNTVEQRMAQATTREEALEVLQSLKEDLYSGDLPLQRDVQPNK